MNSTDESIMNTFLEKHNILSRCQISQVHGLKYMNFITKDAKLPISAFNGSFGNCQITTINTAYRLIAHNEPEFVVSFLRQLYNIMKKPIMQMDLRQNIAEALIDMAQPYIEKDLIEIDAFNYKSTNSSKMTIILYKHLV